MYRYVPIGIVLLTWASLTHAGQDKLMKQAELDLRELNERVLTQVSKDQIPQDGRITVKAHVRNTRTEPEITHVKVKTITQRKNHYEKTD